MKIKNKLIKNFITAFGVVWLEIFKPSSSNKKTAKASTFVNKYNIGV